MVDEVLATVDITGEAADTVIKGDDIGLETVNKVVERLERRYQATSRHVNIGAEGANTVIRMRLGVGVYRDVACRVCGGAAKVIACIEDPVVIKTILAYLEKKAPMDSGVQLPDSRASPQARLFS